MTTPWAAMGSWSSYIDFASVIDLGQSYITQTVITGWLTGQLGAATVAYTADVAAMVLSFAASAYVIQATVLFAISFTSGFYYQYAGASNFANRLAIYELVVVILWLLFALWLSLSALYGGYMFWGKLDERLALASASSIGLENAFTWVKAIKSSVLLLLTGYMNLLSGYAMVSIAEQAIAYFDEYSDKTDEEGTDKKTGKADLDGTSVEIDIYTHMATTLYGFFALGTISFGANWFIFSFMPGVFNDGFTCNLDDTNASKYSGFAALASTMKSRATCMAVIDQIFAIEDIDGNGLVTRCEDAKFQYSQGSTKEYALNFSSQYTLGAFQAICNENFSS